MKALPIQTIIQWVEGRVESGRADLTVNRVALRLRQVRPRTVFFNLRREPGRPGRAGGGWAVVTDVPFAADPPGGVTIIRVANVRAAYWRMVDGYRALFDIPVIGVTGTCGKTTTKEMIRHILAKDRRVIATYKSRNARFRHMSYLLRIDERTQAAVFEMGVAAPGDMQQACRYFRPRVGVVTNIGVDHLGAFGGLAGYVRAKAAIMDGVDPAGTLVLNADDANIRAIRFSRFPGRLVTFGQSPDANYRILSAVQEAGRMRVALAHAGQRTEFRVPGYGTFTASNAAAAIAAAAAIGVDWRAAAARLATFHPAERHFEFKRGVNGSTVIDDSWSTNPTSAVEALRLFRSLSQGKTAVAVLGRMALLGRQSGAYHYQVGCEAGRLGIDRLLIIGAGAEEIRRGALETGMEPGRVLVCRSSAEAAAALLGLLNPQTVCLVKTTMLESYADLVGRITLPGRPPH